MTTLKKLKETLGPTSPKVPLNADIIEQVTKGGYEELKVEYDVEAGERISSLSTHSRKRQTKLTRCILPSPARWLL